MTNIYDQHKAAFARVAAYVVLNGAGERVATVAFKYPRDGAGRLYCYFHVIGARMTRGFASGGGYDKATAAACAAAQRIAPTGDDRWTDNTRANVIAIQAAIKDRGYDWTRELENSGFIVWQAV